MENNGLATKIDRPSSRHIPLYSLRKFGGNSDRLPVLRTVQFSSGTRHQLITLLDEASLKLNRIE
jgi:hypothetical protein